MTSKMAQTHPASLGVETLALDRSSRTRAKPLGSVPLLTPGQTVGGKYRVDGTIGEGGMGMVVAAHEIGVERPVAIKLLHPAWAADREFSARFLREARAMTKLTNEHFVRLLDIGELASGQPFLVMERLDGIDLSALVDAQGPLPVSDVADYVLQACEALAEAHSIGIVHRDLKPSNMYLARRADGTTGIKVLDFGIAKMSSEDEGEIPQSLTTSSAFLGSPAYMSPEQLLCARDVGMQADIWSLGAIMHKLLAGRPPFLAQTMLQVCSLIVSSPPGRVCDLRSDVPAELQNVILRCLRREPADRFRNVGELARALAPFAPAAALASIDRVSSALALGSARDAATRRRTLAKHVAMGVAGLALAAGATAGLVALRTAKHAPPMSWARSSLAAIHATWDDQVAAAAPPSAMPSASALASRAVQPPSEVAAPPAPSAEPVTSASSRPRSGEADRTPAEGGVVKRGDVPSSASSAASAHAPVATHAAPRRPLAAVPKVGHAEFGGRK